MEETGAWAPMEAMVATLVSVEMGVIPETAETAEMEEMVVMASLCKEELL